MTNGPYTLAKPPEMTMNGRVRFKGANLPAIEPLHMVWPNLNNPFVGEKGQLTLWVLL